MGTSDSETPNLPRAATPPGERLDSWKEIAWHLNKDVRTVQRWEETAGLPVYRKAQGRLKGSPVYAYKSELDAWLRQSSSPPAEKQKEAEGARTGFVRNRSWVLRIVCAIAVLAAAGTVLWRVLRPKYDGLPLRVVRLTSYLGDARQPAFSPDGRQIAFAWNGEKQDNFDIYVRFVDGGDEPLRLTTNADIDGWPAWSPDGRTIAFWRWTRGTPYVDVMTVPALGGSEREILRFRIPPQPGANFPGLCWTPDGKWIITPYSPNPDVPGPSGLALVSVQTLEVRPLTRPAPATTGNCCPAITRDGSTLAFLGGSTGRIPNVYLLPLGPDYRPEGDIRQLTSEPEGASNPMWIAGGKELLYIVRAGGARALWRMSPRSGRPAVRVESVGPIGIGWAISTRGDRLAYSDREVDSDIWRVDLPGGKRVEKVVSSSASDVNPEISPEGGRVAFLSNRRGPREVWVTTSDGGNPINIAKTGGMWTFPARWSPDGSQIAFECQNEGNDDICVVPSGGGAVRRLTWNQAREACPSWSRDGKWIYFTSNRSGQFQIWKAPSERTDAEAVQVTKSGGSCALESADGTTVFFAAGPAATSVWQIPAGGGPESQVGPFRFLGTAHNFVVRPEGVYYASSTEPEQWFDLNVYSFASAKSEVICRIQKRFGEGLSVSADGRWAWFAANEARYGDIYLVENFR